MALNFQSGLILRCDQGGMITAILHEEEQMRGLARPNQAFAAMASRESFTKALDFLATIRREGSAFDWEIAVPARQGELTCRLSGGVIDGDLVIAAVPNDHTIDKLIEEMARINSGHVTTLRRLVRERSTQAEAQESALEALSRTNNELVTTQRQLAKANASLATANAMKNRLIGMVAHDLRNPISTISGYAQMLQMGQALPPVQAGYVEQILRGCRFMVALTEDVLSLSAIDSGRMVASRQSNDIGALVDDAITLISPSAEAKGIILAAPPPAEPLLADVDGIKIQQILINLIGNAVKFSQSGGTVTVTASRDDARLRLAIADHGQGIPPEHLATLFEPFGRGTSGTSGELSTGLGLYICSRLAEAHGGHIEVQSKLGQGTTMTVVLPV